MCGFAGLVSARNELGFRKRKAAIEALRHRGPDDSGTWTSENTGDIAVALCATRLAVRDLTPSGHQPMVSPRTGVVLCFNGELYNLTEVRARLERQGYVFRGTSDTEVVLAAYEEWGSECVRRFNAMFSLALWDPRGRNVFLARDRLGIKPLYYSVTGDGVSFASEIRALRALSTTSNTVSDNGLSSFLAFGAVSEPHSLLDGVSLLPAGHTLSWSAASGASVTEYWSLESCFERTSSPTAEEASATVRELLASSVSMQLGSDVPVGVFLSGGIDSGSLVALASEALADPVSTVSLVFDDLAYSEAPLIQATSRRYSTTHRQWQLAGSDFLRLLPSAVSAMDQPTVDGVNTYVVSKLAREAGLTVALSGIGGDELFAGYRSFVEIPGLERLRSLPAKPLRAAVAGVTGVRMRPDRAEKLRASLDLDRSDSRDVYAIYRGLFSPAAVGGLMGDVAIAQNGSSTAANIPDRVNAVSYLEMSSYMRNVLLRDADVMSMAHSLELRVPFLDHRLVEYVAMLPGSVKLRRGVRKPLLVDALAADLPEPIRRERKRGFTLPFETWMQTDLRSEVDAVLLDSSRGGAIGERLDSREVGLVWRAFLAGKLHWSRPWALYVLKRWGELHTAV